MRDQEQGGKKEKRKGSRENSKKEGEDSNIAIRERNRYKLKSVIAYIRARNWGNIMVSELTSEEEGVIWMD